MKRQPYLVGISGGSGCGKTTILNSLFDAMLEGELALISQDNYYKHISDQPVDDNGKENFDTPDSFRRDELIDHINRLSKGELLTYDEYTFNNENAVAGTVTVEPAPIILIEGLFVFHFPEINDILNYKVFIDAHEEIRLERRIKRDWTERGYPEHEVLYQWENHVMPAFKAYQEPHIDQCDLIIDNTRHYREDLEHLITHLRSLL